MSYGLDNIVLLNVFYRMTGHRAILLETGPDNDTNFVEGEKEFKRIP